jgi:hypothetical protein
MNKDTIVKIKSILRNHPDIFFPLKKLYTNNLVGADLPSIQELIAELKTQPDLVITKNLRTRDEDDPVVMLRERIPTLDEIASKIDDSINGTLENLNQVYSAGIGGMAQEEEDLLLEAMRRTKNMRTEMERLFADIKRQTGDTGKTMADPA